MFISTLQHTTHLLLLLLFHRHRLSFYYTPLEPIFHVIFYICFLRSWLDFVFSSCFALHCCILRDNSLFTRVYCS
uniref:Uncharacterized protein n=1 Tax=Anopheles braziliensis TaxID=58242 RepID=A0A2M3ZLD6_9DIPT